jgi:hypothetical protein
MSRAAPFAGVLFAAGIAHAGSADTIGLSPEDIALAGSMAARPAGFAATYHNPAGLAPHRLDAAAAEADGEVALGFVYAHPLVYAERSDGSALPLAAEAADTRTFVAGGRAHLGAPFGVGRLALGLALELPTRNIFRWSIHPDDRPQWLLLTDRTEHIGFRAALSWRLDDVIALGGGASVLFTAETLTTGRITEVDRLEDGTLDVRARLGEEVTVAGRVAPLAGVLVSPHERIDLGLAYRGESYVDDFGWTRVQGVPAAGDVGHVHHFAHYFSPHTVVLAVAARPHRAVTVSADLAWANWAAALTTNHAALGPGRFGDTLIPAAGVSLRAAERLDLFAGYRFVRSPFDNLGGPTNLLDNDQHVASLGGRIALGTLAESSVAFALGYALRLAVLVAREEEKDPRRFESDAAFLRNPGRAPYRFGGAVPGASLAVEAAW